MYVLARLLLCINIIHLLVSYGASSFIGLIFVYNNLKDAISANVN